MTKSSLPDIEVLRQLLSYDATTGLLTWKERSPEFFVGGKYPPEWRAKRWNTRHAGKPFGTPMKGYVIGRALGSAILAHRAIWAMEYGYWPDEVDHINHDRSDNRLSNLRDVPRAENQKNRSLAPNNKSGIVGICWHRQHRKWQAYITAENRKITIGVFKEKSAAIAAREAAEVKFGYHPNHGQPKACQSD